MKSFVLAITGASAMQIGERSIQLLLKNNIVELKTKYLLSIIETFLFYI